MLQIVKASAGSGKTHKLTEEYINLLFKNEENYKHILAITFTHKATEEMKSRIIRKLDEYSRTSSSKEKQEKSRKLLSSILFDYDMFHISTIDSFFQSIVRSFVRETGLQHGYGVELESKIVLEEAVDRLIMGLDRDTSSSVLKHMIDFAKARAKEGESWNIRKEMHTLAMELDRENYKLYAEVLQRVVSEEDYLTNYIEILKRIINKKKQTIRSLCNRAIAIIEQTQWGITSKNDWRNVFYKAKREDIFEPNKTQQEKLSSPSSWVTRTMKKEEKEKAQEAISLGLDKIALELLGELSHSTEYISALLIRKQIYIVGLLSDINEEKNILGKETNSFLLSDTTHFLQLITQDSDVPFIYEKTGVHIDHYMLDEFQDTSLMQWNSLSPLIHDCLDQSNECLIVGDVKQSIYRWRNSDSSLMGEKIAKEFSGYKMSTPSLKENYRSGANIVEFNNTFFEGIANKLREEIKNTYPSFQGKFLTSSYGEDDLKQQSASKDKGGYVGITFLSNKKEEQERTKALEKLKEIIDDLLNRNYPYSDIVILIRNKAEAEIIIDYFSHVEGEQIYPFLSDEALLLNQAKSIRIILSSLQYLMDGNEKLYKISLQGEWSQERESRVLALSNQSLFEMCEEIVGIFSLDTSQEGAYISSFMDLVLNYVNTLNGSVYGFLKWWEENGENQSLFSPDGGDAIRITTIHKSKGLEFAVVILPFCDWNFLPSPLNKNFLWCKPEGEPFSLFPILPIEFGKRMGESIFKNDYEEEVLHYLEDNLNLLYVSFTRPKKELYIITSEKKRNSSEFTAYSLLKTLKSPEQELWEMGEKRQNETPMEEASFQYLEPYHMENTSNRIHIRCKAKEFWNENYSKNYGNLMHSILGRIERKEDISNALQNSLYAGEITLDEVLSLQEELEELLSFSRETQSWFDGSYKILNERNIILPKKHSFRPDRIMMNENEIVILDYKFGAKMESSYIWQVRNYIRLFNEMGFSLPIKGYLWYVELGQIVPIEQTLFD